MIDLFPKHQDQKLYLYIYVCFVSVSWSFLFNKCFICAKKQWYQKGGSQLDSKLSGGPWALKMESGTECTVCAILKMSSDNSSFETGVGILWLMCTWAFQVLYSRAWQTSVATWPGVRDIWMKIALRFTLMCSTWAWSVPSNAWSYLKMINWDNLFRILYILVVICLDLIPQMPDLILKLMIMK